MTVGPRGGQFSKHFAMKMSPDQYRKLKWLSERIGRPMGMILRDQIATMFDEETRRAEAQLQRERRIAREIRR